MFSVGEVDVKGLRRFENMLGALGADAPKAVARAINHTGDKARTQVIRALSRQTGLPQRIIRTAIKDGPETRRASPESPTYTLSAGGGDVRVKFFKKRETRAGVVAHLGTVRGRTLFPRTFFRGGAFPGKSTSRPLMATFWTGSASFDTISGTCDPVFSSLLRWSKGQAPRRSRIRLKTISRAGWTMKSAAFWPFDPTSKGKGPYPALTTSGAARPRRVGSQAAFAKP